MAAASENLRNPIRPALGAPVDGRWLILFLLVMAVIAVVAVVAATMMGQSTAALVIGLVSAAFYAGLIC